MSMKQTACNFNPLSNIVNREKLAGHSLVKCNNVEYWFILLLRTLIKRWQKEFVSRWFRRCDNYKHRFNINRFHVYGSCTNDYHIYKYTLSLIVKNSLCNWLANLLICYVWNLFIDFSMHRSMSQTCVLLPTKKVILTCNINTIMVVILRLNKLIIHNIVKIVGENSSWNCFLRYTMLFRYRGNMTCA